MRNTVMLILALIGAGAWGDKEFLISDSDFLSTRYGMESCWSIARQYPKCKLTDDQLNIIAKAGERNGVNPVVLMALIEKENQLVRNNYCGEISYQRRLNRAAGYGLDIKDRAGRYRWYGFDVQVNAAAWELSKRFREYKPGTYIKFQLNEAGGVLPASRATAAMYIYTPQYGRCREHGQDQLGNIVFEQCFREFMAVLR